MIADKGASVDHRMAIMYRAPWLTFVGKGKAIHRHPLSLNCLLESFVKTRFWCQWEDDWSVPAGSARAAGGDLLQRAIDVRRATGCHQVSMNGAFCDNTPGPYSSEYATSREQTPSGCVYVVTALKPSVEGRIRDAVDVEELTLLYGNKFGSRQAGSWPWPLFSLQPSLLDTEFMRSHVHPFSTKPHMNPPNAYWLFEMEAALRFVRGGGRKASIHSSYVARPIAVRSSSHNWGS